MSSANAYCVRRFAIIAMTRASRFTLTPCKEAASTLLSSLRTFVSRLRSTNAPVNKIFWGAADLSQAASEMTLVVLWNVSQ